MYEVKGEKDLIATLDSIKNESEKTVGTAMALAAVKVKNRARGRVPKVTRTLERSIHPDNLQVGNSKVTIDIGTDVEYARRIELGFAGTDSLGRRYNQPAHPYLRPALMDSKQEVQQDVSRAMKAMIRSKARK